MNKIYQYLLPVSLTALACALLGGGWLVWETVEESRALERHNRELQASLEASRIRVSNFCEYPQDVLCRVDERSGLVAGAMPGDLADAMNSQDSKEHMPALAESHIPASTSAPAVAIENVKNIARAQAEVPAQVMPHSSAPKLPALPSKDMSTSPESGNSALTQAKESTAKKPLPEDKVPASVSPVLDSPAAAVLPSVAPATHTTESAPSEVQKEKSSALENTATDESSVPNYRQEAAGLLSVPSPSEIMEEVSAKTSEEQKAAPEPPFSSAPKTSEAVESKAQKPKNTWSRVDRDGDIFVFTITGAGPSLPAEGELLTGPMRYELKLPGRWDVRQFKNIRHRLVKRIHTKQAKGDTVVTFQLKSKPYRCSLHRIDDRTVTVRIR
ncbi:hypothetical protein [Mailhella sp.]